MQECDTVQDADVIVIGGGAAGMFSACLLAEKKLRVMLIEPNHKLGRKLRITGKGRCNLTNNSSPDDVIKKINRNSKFMYSSLNRFTPQDVMMWFENRGVPLKTERGGRVFPVSDKADDVADAMQKLLEHKNVKIIRDRAVSIMTDGGIVLGTECEKCSYFSKNVILATGGMSYPKTGSTGDGYRMAERLGHTVTELKPSLVPVVLSEGIVADLAGLALKNVTLSLYEEGRKQPVFSELGEMNFLTYGISGPLTLSASCFMQTEKLREGKYLLTIDLKPGLSHERLERRIDRDFGDTPSERFENSLTRLLPSQLIDTVVKLSKIPPLKQCNQITRAEREDLCRLLKRFELTPESFRPIDEAIITSGGVGVKEINPVTMESKLVKGLYFAGEIIDVDAVTGGYNLQIAFSTSNAAVQAIYNSVL